ncbi:MAG: NADP-dependent malic enzyme [bacterium]
MRLEPQEVLDYHAGRRPGKIEIIPSKPCRTQRDISLAYTPGVAEVCSRIRERPELAYRYTLKGNLVAVVTNGTAVLGLGNIGALAAKPVMEGKAVLFKRFADIDAIDIELDCSDADRLCEMVKGLEPTFGGINLEDIKAPECFYIEGRLREEMHIPVLHDDQHGTAIVSAAALLNALEIAGKRIGEVRVVFCGAGAAGISCARLYRTLGVRPENILVVDRFGVIFSGRAEGMNPYKQEFAGDTSCRTLADAMKEADVFVGVSGPGLVSQEMVRSMAKDPIVFALANPDAEIGYEEAMSARPDVIMATGRSDYPNQVNNVLCFPYLFRGALDVGATKINEEMKIAAVHALAGLAREDVPDSVLQAYRLKRLQFGREYILPKPFDPRVLAYVSAAVVKAAAASGVARAPIEDFGEYQDRLARIHGSSRVMIRKVIHKIRPPLKSIVFPDGHEEKVIRASQIIVEEHIARPILIGNEEDIRRTIRAFNFNEGDFTVINPLHSPERVEKYAREFYKLRQRKGVDMDYAFHYIQLRNYFGAMMVHMGDADGYVSGLGYNYTDSIRPALQIVKLRQGRSTLASVYMAFFGERTYFLADCTINIDPTAAQLAEIALSAAHAAEFFNIEPRVAMLSFSNFGRNKHPAAEKIRQAVRMAKQMRPELLIDGEMQADVAVVPELMEAAFPFCELKGRANVLIFPELNSANICFRLLKELGNAELLGPVLMGMERPVNVMPRVSTVEDIVNMAAITALEIDYGPV